MGVKVAVVKCSSYSEEELYSAVKEALKLIGFKGIKKGSRVLLKPNVLSQAKPEQAITTHPAVVAAVCRIANESKAHIQIGDSSGMGSYGFTAKALKRAGIEDVAKRYKAKLVSFEGSGSKRIKDKNAVVLKELSIAKPALDAELLINLPKLKTHTFTKYTGAVKNLFGCVPGAGKAKCHTIAKKEDKFCNLLLDVYQNIKPGLSIMDAVVGLEGNGPGSAGIPKKTGLIIASEDAVALDMVASKIIGYNPLEIKTNSNAVKRGLFPKDELIEVLGQKSIYIPYKKPITRSSLISFFIGEYLMKVVAAKPFTDNERCIKCGICAKVCPEKAISLKPYPVYDRKRCILCYCCHENCPENAIFLKKIFVGDLVAKIRKWGR